MVKNLLKYRKKTKDIFIDAAIEISLEESLKEFEGFPIGWEDKNSFIGFEINDEIIQFIRLDENEWLIDLPSLAAEIDHWQTSLNTNRAKIILTAFSKRQDWRKMLAHFVLENILSRARANILFDALEKKEEEFSELERARQVSPSLRAPIPRNIVEGLKIANGDVLNWTLEARERKMVAVVEKAESSE